MEHTYKVIWNDNEIGEISDLSRDMWYIDGIWTPFHTYLSIEFEQKLKSSDLKKLMQNPQNALRVVLQNISEPSAYLHCLAMGFDEKVLLLRQITSTEALDVFFPNRKR